ncbi:hypothetical protein DSL92_06280 [Billgrantia gudaonensis]|uniref:DUF4214 domain-containing protein n=1 Tax=Billgrantia gudaonensis TaxID=376427 RepID=A0A3S0NH97_9GAMM|nr:hypothetical protein DSL92_06280 [Halomonas gudaonensis]
MLEREPDAAGYTYWQQRLQADCFRFRGSSALHQLRRVSTSHHPVAGR